RATALIAQTVFANAWLADGRASIVGCDAATVSGFSPNHCKALVVATCDGRCSGVTLRHARCGCLINTGATPARTASQVALVRYGDVRGKVTLITEGNNDGFQVDRELH